MKPKNTLRQRLLTMNFKDYEIDKIISELEKELPKVSRIRNKDHDLMMSYLEADDPPSHASYAWWHHSRRGAEYINKLEKVINELRSRLRGEGA